MAGIGKKFDSLRFNRFDNERLTLALLLSLVAHLLAWSGYETNKKLDLWQRLHPHAKTLVTPLPLPAQNSEPEIFMDVEQPSPDAPKNAKYYSSKNSRAANPDTDQNTDQPKLNGKQTDVPQTRDTPRTKISKAQPSESAKNENQRSQPKPMVQSGDWSRSPPEDSQQPEQPQPRPRTIKEALAQRQNLRPSIPMQQEGGVRRRADISSLDAKATPFGEYDEALIDAVRQCWYDALDKTGYSFDRQGYVVLTFRLHSDGRVTDTVVLEDTADDKPGGIWAILCQAALGNAAPFAPWPSDMLHKQGANYRDLRFQFDYYLP